MIATKRIMRELCDFKKDSIQNVTVEPIDGNLFHLLGTIVGPEDTPYEGGVFQLDINIPNNYPFWPPKIKFRTLIYHLNINQNGQLSLDILKNQWSPAFSIPKVLFSISVLLAYPNAQDPFMVSIAKIYQSDRPKFDIIAHQWTKKHAWGLNNK